MSGIFPIAILVDILITLNANDPAVTAVRGIIVMTGMRIVSSSKSSLTLVILRIIHIEVTHLTWGLIITSNNWFITSEFIWIFIELTFTGVLPFTVMLIEDILLAIDIIVIPTNVHLPHFEISLRELCDLFLFLLQCSNDLT